MVTPTPNLILATAFWFMAVAQLASPQAATAYSSGECIHGTVSDRTPDYSEDRIKDLERVMAKYDPKIEDPNRDLENAALHALLKIADGPRKPLPNVTVILSTVPTAPGANELHLITITDAQGKFSFSNVTRGVYYVEAKIHRGFLARPFEIKKKVEHYHYYDTVDLDYYSRPANLRGRITDSSGQPLASVKVIATQRHFNEEGVEFPTHIVSTLSTRDGTYELPGLMPGNAYTGPVNYNIRAEKQNYVTSETRVPVATEEVFSASKRLWRILLKNSGPDGAARLAEMEQKLSPPDSRQGCTINGIDLVLGSPSKITGRAVDSQNIPQPGCDVWLVPVKDRDAPHIQDVMIPKPVLTQSQGAFEFQGVPAGRYAFRIGKDSRWMNTGPTNFMIGEGQVITGLTLTVDFQPLGHIEAHVRNKETGTPITNFSASVWSVTNPKEYSSAGGCIKMKPFGPGTFSVENISSGKAEMEITAPGHVTEHLYVDVLPGQTTPLNVQMVRAGKAGIRLIRNGAPLEPSENLQAFSVETDAVTYGRNGPKEGGDYEISGLKPGPYIIRAHVFEGKKCIRYEAAPITIVADKSSHVTLDFSGSSTLALILSMPTDLRAQIWVEVADAPLNQPLETNLGMRAYLWPERPGKYEVKYLRPGAYRVCAKLIDPAKGKAVKPELPPPQSKPVSLDEGKTTTVEFHF